MKHLHNTCCNTCFSGACRWLLNQSRDTSRTYHCRWQQASVNVPPTSIPIRTFTFPPRLTAIHQLQDNEARRPQQEVFSPQGQNLVQNTRQELHQRWKLPRGEALTSNGVDVNLAEACSPNVLDACLDALAARNAPIISKRIQGTRPMIQELRCQNQDQTCSYRSTIQSQWRETAKKTMHAIRFCGMMPSRNGLRTFPTVGLVTARDTNANHIRIRGPASVTPS